MAVKYVKDFMFPSEGGFHKGNMPSRAKASAEGMPSRAMPNAPARGAARMMSRPTMGKGQGYNQGGYVPGKEMDRLPAKKPPGMGKDLAPSKPFKGEYQGYAKGGTVSNPRMQSAPKATPKAQLARPAAKPAARPMARPAPRPMARPAPRPVARPVARPIARAAAPSSDRVYAQPTRDNVMVTPMPPQLPGPTIEIARDERPVRSPIGSDYAADKRSSSSAPGLVGGLTPGTGPKGVGPVMGGFSSMDVVYDPRTNTMGPSIIGSSNIGSQDAPYVFNPRHLKKGGLAYAKGPKAEKKVAKVMREYKKGELHSGSKKGPVVKNPKQAIAIALSEARGMKKAKGGEVFSDEYLAYGDKKGPYRGSPKKAKMLGRRDRRAREAMERAEKYAPGMSLDMPDEAVKKAKGGDVKKAVHKHEREMHPGKPLTKLRRGGVPAYGRKAMYGGGKC